MKKEVKEDKKAKKVTVVKNPKSGKKTVKKTITKNMLIGEVMKLKPNAGEVFMGFGLHCFSCPMSAMESLEEAAQLHEVDLDLMLEKLNEL